MIIIRVLTLKIYCNCKNVGIKVVSAETTQDNKAMISVFRKLDFNVNFNDDTTVTVFKNM